MTKELCLDTPQLNLAFTHFDHRVGMLRVIGTWDLHHPRRAGCLVLVRADARMDGTDDTVPCIVSGENAYLWSPDPKVGDEFGCAFMAMKFAPALRLDPHRADDLILIVEAVRSRLNDLIMIPPAPRNILKQRALGDVTIKANGRSLEKEVTVDV